jgi:hypothetical protein
MLLDIEIRHVKYNPDNMHYKHTSYSAFFLKTRAVGFVVAKSYEYEELFMKRLNESNYIQAIPQGMLWRTLL